MNDLLNKSFLCMLSAILWKRLSQEVLKSISDWLNSYGVCYTIYFEKMKIFKIGGEVKAHSQDFLFFLQNNIMQVPVMEAYRCPEIRHPWSPGQRSILPWISLRFCRGKCLLPSDPRGFSASCGNEWHKCQVVLAIS